MSKQIENEENLKPSLENGGHRILKCSSCRKALCDIWVTRPKADMVYKYRALCPYCGDKSFITEIRGGVHYGGIADLNPDSETDDDLRTYTVVEDYQWCSKDEVVELIVKKV